MRIRAVLLAASLVLLLCLCAWANVAPEMEDQYVATVQDTPVTFVVRASDEDIDPLDAEAHPMRFVILEGPSHGVLIGDLTKVRCEGPHDVVVDMTYVPADGFVGTDFVTIAVFDPFDETDSGTTTIQIDVKAKRMVGLLSGTWDVGLSYDADAMTFGSFDSRLMGVYRIGQLMLQGIGGLRMETAGVTTFNPLRFQGSLSIGDVSLRSTVAFDPEKISTESFDYLRTTVQFALFGVKFMHQLYLDNVQTRSYQTLMARGSVDDLDFAISTRFDMKAGCGVVFSQSTLTMSFEWCDLKIRSSMSLSCEGFNSAVVGVYDYPLPGFVFPSLGVYANVVTTFEPDEKTVSPTLQLRTKWLDCVRLLGELVLDGATKIEGFSFYGLTIKEEIGGVTFRAATSFDPKKNASVTGQGDYFELISLSGRTASCCDVIGTWSIATYFQNDHPTLFSWGMTKTSLNVGIAEALSLSLSITAQTGGFGDPKTEFAFGFTLRW
jgi:hypothetical protein